jgi:hypothetical protein
MTRAWLIALASAATVAVMTSGAFVGASLDAPSRDWCNAHRASDGAVLWNLAPGTCERYWRHRDDGAWQAMMEQGEAAARRCRDAAPFCP